MIDLVISIAFILCVAAAISTLLLICAGIYFILRAVTVALKHYWSKICTALRR
jgi:hypothetical protein